jgi:hypothetical protein
MVRFSGPSIPADSRLNSQSFNGNGVNYCPKIARLRVFLAAYAILNALLYSMLLPLWEGFDEPFHFGYIQQLANFQGWPDPRISRLSAEVGSSMELAPVSYPVKVNLPTLPTFSEYYRMPFSERAEMRRRLREIPTAFRHEPSDFVNYEALQAPLAYMVMAIPERMLSRTPLRARVLILRILVAILSVLGFLAGAEALFRALRIPLFYAASAIFCLLSCQMLWATIAHVGNDWLAVPLSVWLLVVLLRYYEKPAYGAAAVAAAVLAAAMLTKAYFLVAVPLLPALCLWRRRWLDVLIVVALVVTIAGPWHARNVRRYGDITGTIETQSVGVRKGFQAAVAMPWRAVAGSAVRRSLWTGNNSAISYSATTLNVLITAMLLGWGLWAFGRHTGSERVVLAYCGLFGSALAYGAVFAWLATNGAVKGAQPWYFQTIAPAAFGLCFLGSSRRPAIGRFVASALVLISGYVVVTTYFGKLIPWYGGYDGRITVRSIVGLYHHNWPLLRSNLDSVTLGSASAILTIGGVVTTLALLMPIHLLVSLWVASVDTSPGSSKR